MVFALKKAWTTLAQAPRHFMFFGLVAYAVTMIGALVPFISLFTSYFVLPAVYMSVALAAQSGEHTSWGVKPQWMAMGKGFVHAGTLGLMLLFQLVLGSILLGFVVALFLDAETAAAMENIQREAADDPELMMDMLLNDVEWVRSRFLGMALFLMGLAFMALGIQAWFVRVFEHQSFFASIRVSFRRGKSQFGLWIVFSFFVLVVWVLESATQGLLRLVSFPFLSLTHYFLYEKMRS